MEYVLAKTVKGKSVNLLQDFFCKHEMYLSKSARIHKSIFIQLRDFVNGMKKLKQ